MLTAAAAADDAEHLTDHPNTPVTMQSRPPKRMPRSGLKRVPRRR
jgi:hypothetical protein